MVLGWQWTFSVGGERGWVVYNIFYTCVVYVDLSLNLDNRNFVNTTEGKRRAGPSLPGSA